MGDVFITRRGGGAQLFAAIGVEYPSGSKCSCTDGAGILSAGSDSGKWVFPIPRAGDWTVSCSEGEKSRSRTVTISERGQCEKIQLGYSLKLFESGAGLMEGYSARSLPEGKNTVSDSAISIGNSNTERCILYLSPALDCSGYSQLKVSGMQTDSGGGSGSTLTVGLVKSLPTGTAESPVFAKSAAFDMAKLNEEQALTVDIGGLEGEYYFAVCAYYVAPGEISSVELC